MTISILPKDMKIIFSTTNKQNRRDSLGTGRIYSTNHPNKDMLRIDISVSSEIAKISTAQSTQEKLEQGCYTLTPYNQNYL